MTETYCEDCNGEGLYETTNPTNGLQDSWKCNACAGSGMGPAPSSDWLDVIENRLKSPHTSFFFGGQPMDHVFSEVEVDRLVSEVKRLREVEATLQAVEREVAEVYVILTGGRVSKANTLSSVVVGEAEAYNERTCVADAWDEGYRLGDDDGYLRAHSDIRGECAAPPATNPYRTEVSDGSE